MPNIEALNAVDQAIMDVSIDLKPLTYSEPVNAKDQKRAFLAGEIGNPQFLYKDLEYDPREVVQRLGPIEIPDDELGAIFKRKRQSALLTNRIIQNMGDEDFVREATISLHGSPDESLVTYADELLRQIPGGEAPRPVPADVVKDALQQALYDYGLTDWTVELSDKSLTDVQPDERKITVGRNRKFDQSAPQRLKVHEVGVHVLRGANGYEQPLNMFALGLPGYLPTEEGLASYAEEVTGNLSEEKMRDYAARVIAVDSVCQDLDFRQTFDRLRAYDLTDNQSWTLALRAHRGGGYIKDHVYLDGYRRVKDFAETDGDFDSLYVGKVGIEDLPLVRRLLQEGILTEAKHKPPFVR